MFKECSKVRAERRAGELLKVTTVKGGERHKLLDGTCERVSKLEDIGISKSQSSRWQAIADIPEPVFEEHIARAKDAA